MRSQNNILIEVCTDGYEMSLDAVRNGASRLELCSAISEGGLTPALSLTESVCRDSKVPVMVMIRPRAGDFCYSRYEFDLMKDDVLHAKKAGAAGVVFGILLPDGSVDIKRCEQLIELARPMQVTFHRAFDMTSDPFLAMEEIITLGAETILTSGQRQVAEDGLELIRELVKRAGDRISIMAGSGVNPNNILLLHEVGIKAFHFTCRKRSAGNMKYRNESLISMGAANNSGEYDIYVFDEHKMNAVKEALREIS